MQIAFQRYLGPTWLLVVTVATPALASCRDHARSRPAPSDSTSAVVATTVVAPGSASAGPAASAEPTAPRLAPLHGDWMERLELPDGGSAYVAPPLGATEPRPVVVAVHGAIDDAGLMCSAWRLVADVYPFVVCPAGTTVRPNTYVWGSSEQIEKRVNESLAALIARYGDHVARTPVVYAGFSQGANMAGPLLKKNAKRMPRAILTEGGYRAFDTAESAAALAKGGGERVMFSCSQAGCAHWFDTSRGALERAGVSVRVVDSGQHGHSMPPAVRESLNAALPWLVDGLPGWETYASAPKLASH